MAGIKSQHNFVTAGGYLYMLPTSCTCQPCKKMMYGECELMASGKRGGGKQVDLKASFLISRRSATTLAPRSIGDGFCWPTVGWTTGCRCAQTKASAKRIRTTSRRIEHVVVVSCLHKLRS